MSKLLLVEDDNNLREIYEARLQAEGYTIVTAKDGEEALVIAKAERPDLIISDVMMPKISGFEMLDILRNTENLKTVLVIMLTALGQNDDQQRADKLGADRYLVKSQVTLEDIVKVTHELLGDEPTTEAAAPSPAEAAPAPGAPPATPAPTPEPEPVVAPPEAPEAAPAVPVTATTDEVQAPPAPAPATPPSDTPAATDDTPQPASDPAPTREPEPVVAPTPDATEVEAAPTATAIPVSDDVPSTEETPAPAADASADTAASTDQSGQTIAQEGAAVEARIEDFVTGATQDATPAPETEDASPEIVVSAANSAASDEEISPAPVDNSETENQEAIKEAVENIEVKSQAEETANETPAESTPEPSDETTTPPAETSTVVHDKVIKPLESDPKKDINTLLALEAVKEANEKQEAPAPAVVVASTQEPAATAASEPTALGENPTPSSVIAPIGPPETPIDDTKPVIIPSGSAIEAPAAEEEPGTDLSGIAI